MAEDTPSVSGQDPVTPPVEALRLPDPIVRIRPEISTFLTGILVPVSSDVDSVFSREKNLTPRQLLLFPYLPTGPVYSLERNTTKNDGTFHVDHLKVTAGVVSEEVSLVEKGSRVLVPLPHDTEIIRFSLGQDASRRAGDREVPSFVVKAVKGRDRTEYVMYDSLDRQVGQLAADPIMLASQQSIKTTTLQETTYPDGRAPTEMLVVGEKIDMKNPIAHCVVSLVTGIDGRSYMLVEGTGAGVTVQLSSKLVKEAKDNAVSPRELAYGDRVSGLASLACEDHPERNEDFAVNYNGTFMLLDGMGGQGNEGDGYRASRIAASVIGWVLNTIPHNASAQLVGEKFDEAIRLADEVLAQSLPDGGGTTIVLAKQVGRQLVYRKVGDSRLSLFDGEQFIFETVDDSIVGTWENVAKDNGGWAPLQTKFQEYVEKRYHRGMFAENIAQFIAECQKYGYQVKSEGGGYYVRLQGIDFDSIRRNLKRVADTRVYNPIDGYASFLRNFISASVGGGPKRKLTIERGIIDVKPGQRIVLYSDGVSDPATSYQIEKALRVMASKPAAEQAQSLVRLAEAITTGALGASSHPLHAISIDGENTRKKPDDRVAVVAYVQ